MSEAEPRAVDVAGGLTHASFFSGVGGLDIGLERAGWRTVVFHEIEPYASAVLARHWPEVPNGGCIYSALGAPQHAHDDKYRCLHPDTGKPHEWGELADGVPVDGGDALDGLRAPEPQPEGGLGAGDPVGPGGADAEGRAVPQQPERPRVRGGRRRDEHGYDEPASGVRDDDWRGADLFTGGFPCQDLSIAGKRRGLAGHRSGLAFAFLTLVERHRPRALLLENVPGLLSSHRGRDLGALLSLMGELGYGVAYRVLDGRFFGVPQRRRRIFILGLRSGPDDPDGRLAAERAAAVLAVGSRCPWHPAPGTKAGPVPAGGARVGPERYGVDYAGALQAGPHGFQGYDQAGIQGHLQPQVSHALTTTHTRTGRLDPNGETFVVAEVAPTLRSGGHGDPGIGSHEGDHDRLIVQPDIHALEQRLRERGEPDGGLRAAADGGEPGDRHGPHPDAADGASADPGGDGAPDGLAGRVDDRARLEGPAEGQVVSPTLRVGPSSTAAGGPGDTVPVVTVKPFVKIARARAVDGEGERWDEDDVSPTLNTFDNGDARAVTLVAQETAHTILGKPNSSHAADMDTYVVAATLNSGGDDGGFRTEPGEHLVTMGTLREHVRPGSNTDHSVFDAGGSPDEAWWAEYLPEGLDSHRYRCCGNGVISTVAEWIGARLYAELSTPST